MKPNELSKMGRADYVSPSTNVVKIMLNHRLLAGSPMESMAIMGFESNDIFTEIN